MITRRIDIPRGRSGTASTRSKGDLNTARVPRPVNRTAACPAACARQAPPQNRLFFPERNVTMSALTEATVIVEAGETSGTLTQARAALHQGRKLFILDSCFRNASLAWPARFEAEGAIRVRTADDLWAALG
jgi:hypothetical protein